MQDVTDIDQLSTGTIRLRCDSAAPEWMDRDRFVPSAGMSAPIAVVPRHFGFTVERVMEAGKQAIAAG